jgi:hypothetical protein
MQPQKQMAASHAEADDDDDDTDSSSSSGSSSRSSHASSDGGCLLKLQLHATALQREEILRAITLQREAFNFAADLVQKYQARVCWRSLRTAWLGWKKDTNYYAVRAGGFPLRIDTCGIRAFIRKWRSKKQKMKKKKKAHASAAVMKNPKRLIRETLMLEHAVDCKAHVKAFFPVPYTGTRARCLIRIPDLPFRQYHHKHKDLQYFCLEVEQSAIVERLLEEGAVGGDLRIVWHKPNDTFHVLYSSPLPPPPCGGSCRQ